MLNYLLFLSMVHEYAYFVMNIFGNRSIVVTHTHRPTQSSAQLSVFAVLLFNACQTLWSWYSTRGEN